MFIARLECAWSRDGILSCMASERDWSVYRWRGSGFCGSGFGLVVFTRARCVFARRALELVGSLHALDEGKVPPQFGYWRAEKSANNIRFGAMLMENGEWGGEVRCEIGRT